ncbi:MAG TPA: MYG1 family protein [Bryobacteraceae bacterium]|nr:MYG1 family protein [Bryobacteraceae bacterium]
MRIRIITDPAAREDHEYLVVCPTGLPKAPVVLGIGLLAAVTRQEAAGVAIFRTDDGDLADGVPDDHWHFVLGVGHGGQRQKYNHLGNHAQVYAQWEDSLPRSEAGMMYAHLLRRPSDECPEARALCRHVDGRTFGRMTPPPEWWTLGGPRGRSSLPAALLAAAPSHVDGSPITTEEWDEFLLNIVQDSAAGFRGLLDRRPAGFGSLAVRFRAGMAKANAAFTASVERVVPLINAAAGDPVLVLDQYEPAVFDICAAKPWADGEVLFIVHPSSRGDEWMVAVVGKFPGSREARKLLPWKACDCPQGSTFVHPSRRFVFAATKEAAVALARAAVLA